MKTLTLLPCGSMLLIGTLALAEPDYVIPATDNDTNKLLLTPIKANTNKSVKSDDDICISCIG